MYYEAIVAAIADSFDEEGNVRSYDEVEGGSVYSDDINSVDASGDDYNYKYDPYSGVMTMDEGDFGIGGGAVKSEGRVLEDTTLPATDNAKGKQQPATSGYTNPSPSLSPPSVHRPHKASITPVKDSLVASGLFVALLEV